MRKMYQATPSLIQPKLSRRRFIQAAAVMPLILALPGRVFASPGIHKLNGQVFVNNRPANLNTRITAGSKIVVAHDGELAFSIGTDAFLLRGGTALELVGTSVIAGMRLLTGGLLAVFDKRSKPAHMVTSLATIGIHGTSAPNRIGSTPAPVMAKLIYASVGTGNTLSRRTTTRMKF